MPSHRKRREQLYTQYAANLKLVKTAIPLEPDIDDTIVCPVCFRLFDRTALDSIQTLTLDHVPAEALGGRDSEGVLLCGDCNHKLGNKLDASAKVHLSTRDFIDNVPGASKDGYLSFGSHSESVAEFHYDDAGRLIIKRNPQRVNPISGRQEADYLQSLVDKSTVNITGLIRFNDAPPQFVNVAWLRYAYLIFFRQFGYLGILHNNFDLLRKQIQNPTENLLPNGWESALTGFTRLPPGIHAIQRPKDFQSFVVVFDVSTEIRTRRKAIILPNLDWPGLTIYDRLLSLSDSAQSINMEGVQIPPYPEFWTNLQSCSFGLFKIFSA